jgi:hypothetical protein
VKLYRHCRIVAALALAACLAASPTGARAQAVSPVDYGSDSLAPVRLGIALATIGDLADAPELLARPSSQQFVDDTFARIAATTSDDALKMHAARRRTAFNAGPSFDRTAAYAALADETKDTLRAAGANGPLVAFGILAEQTDYNARVLHSAKDDAQDRSAIGREAGVDALVPGLAGLRAKLAALAPSDWDATATCAEAIVAALLGSDVAVPFPRSSGVWLVLLRTRATGAEAQRHALHYWLDIVRFDGTHQTIGAYPDGTFAFDRDTSQLACRTDRELAEPSVAAIPVTPGAGSSSAQLAESLIHLCGDGRTAGLSYRVKNADDDRFIADILFRSGVSVGPLLRAAAGARGGS